MSEAVGGIAEEAAKLFGAAEDWLREHIGDVHQGPECVVCPVCQLLAVVRTARPETFEHLAQAGSSLLQAFQSLVDAHGSGRRAGATIQRIDID